MGQNIHSLFSVGECDLQYVGYTNINIPVASKEGVFFVWNFWVEIGAPEFVLLLLEILVRYRKILLFACDPALLFTL